MSGLRHPSLDEATQAALLRLLEIAYHDTGQSRRVADFLLAWWNADECGGFDLTDIWCLDWEIAQDVRRVFTFIAGHQRYPDTLGFNREFTRVVRAWRPHLFDTPSAANTLPTEPHR